MFKIFISDTILRQVLTSEPSWPEANRSLLHRVLCQQKKLYVSPLSADIAWTKGYGPKLDFSESDYIQSIPSHPEEVLKNPSALYILDIPITEADMIRKAYGVMCISGEQHDISPLIDVNDIHISNERERLGQGWDSVLDSVETLPSNALLLTDRYLFSSTQPKTGDGFANIHDILDQLLPHQFIGGEYHVTVVFDNQSKHPSYTFNDIATQLNCLKQQLGRDYPIMMEVLGVTPDCSIYTKLHNRLIISNYYLVEAGHKLAAFDQEIGTARQMLIPMTLFTESSLYGTSTPPLKAIEQTLSTLRDFSRSFSTLLDHSIYRYALNGRCMEKCMEIRNRLLT